MDEEEEEKVKEEQEQAKEEWKEVKQEEETEDETLGIMHLWKNHLHLLDQCWQQTGSCHMHLQNCRHHCLFVFCLEPVDSYRRYFLDLQRKTKTNVCYTLLVLIYYLAFYHTLLDMLASNTNVPLALRRNKRVLSVRSCVSLYEVCSSLRYRDFVPGLRVYSPGFSYTDVQETISGPLISQDYLARSSYHLRPRQGHRHLRSRHRPCPFDHGSEHRDSYHNRLRLCRDLYLSGVCCKHSGSCPNR